MKTRIYWMMQHNRRAARDLRFRARCWWLNLEVGFLEWRLRLEAFMPAAATDSAKTSASQAGHYVVPTM